MEHFISSIVIFELKYSWFTRIQVYSKLYIYLETYLSSRFMSIVLWPRWLPWCQCYLKMHVVVEGVWCTLRFFFFLNFYFILLCNTVLVLPYIDVNPPRVYMRSQTWTPLSPPSPQHPSRSSLCTSPEHAISCIGHRLAIRFLHDSIQIYSYSSCSLRTMWTVWCR